MGLPNNIFLILYLFVGVDIVLSGPNPFESFLQKTCTRHAVNSQSPMDVVAVILARGGSKGIPLKNLVKLNGLSLLANAILVSKNANVFAQVWVSTDNRRIAAEADRYGAHVHYRPSHLAADKTPSIDAVLEFVQCHRHIQNVALIQCTSVFIKELYLEAAVAAFQSPHVDCVFSALRNWKLRWAHTPDNKLKAINFDASNRPRRQDWNGELVEAGMFYFARRQLIVDNRVFQNDRCKVIEIDEKDALEIDTIHHLRLAEALTHIDSQR